MKTGCITILLTQKIIPGICLFLFAFIFQTGSMARVNQQKIVVDVNGHIIIATATGDYVWHKDNLAQAHGNINAWQITANRAFDGKWFPEQ